MEVTRLYLESRMPPGEPHTRHSAGGDDVFSSFDGSSAGASARSSFRLSLSSRFCCLCNSFCRFS